MYLQTLFKPAAVKKFLIFTAVFFQAALSAYPQASEKELVQIRKWFKDINANLRHYKKVELHDIIVSKDADPGRYSMEGEGFYRLDKVNMTKIFKGEQLVKLTVDLYGDREELTSEYYVRNGELIFVDKVKTIYHRPKWHKAFKETERSVAKNRFYFKGNRLIKWVKWVKQEIRSISQLDPYYKDHEARILHDYSLYISLN